MTKKDLTPIFVGTLDNQENTPQNPAPEILAEDEVYKKFEPFYLKASLALWDIFIAGYAYEGQDHFSFTCGQNKEDNSKHTIIIEGSNSDYVQDCLYPFAEDLCSVAEDRFLTNFDIEAKGNGLEISYNSPKRVLQFIGYYLDRYKAFCPEDVDFVDSGITTPPHVLKEIEIYDPEEKLMFCPPMVFPSTAIAEKCQTKMLSATKVVSVSYEMLDMLYRDCAGLHIPQGMGLSLMH